MAWKWIAKIKNGVNDYNFVVPFISLSSYTPSNSSYDQFSNTAYRSNSAQFIAVSAMLNDANMQKASNPSIYNSHTDGSITKFVYGDAGATALYIVNTRSVSGDTESNIFNPYRYLSFSSNNQITNNTLNLDVSAKAEGNFFGVALVMNEETEQIYLASVDGEIVYRNADHTPNSSDYVYFRVRIYHSSITTTDTGNLWNVFKNSIPSGGGGSDPYEAGGYSDTTPSSSGDFDDDSDSISVPSLPSISAMGAGAISLAVIDEANLGTFMNYILSPSFTGLINISRFFSDPIKAIACLNYMPYTPTNTSGYTLSWGGDDTGASVGAVSAQYEEIDCGSVSLSEFYGSCLDYSPYTSVQLVLPFAGSVDIDPDEFNGKTISVKYHIDNYTGAGLVLVSDGDRVLLQVPCSVSNPIPLTSTDYSAVISAIANVVMGGVSTIAAVYTGGASVGASVALAGGFAASAAGNVMSAKLHYNHGGSMGMGTGMFGVLKPYLIIKRPRQCLPERNGSFQGYPAFVTENLGDLSGFTKIAEIHLDSIPVTTDERAELLAILKGGVIF